MKAEDKKIAKFIRDSRAAGVTDTALAEQFELPRATFGRRISTLEAAGLDCGKPRGRGPVPKELKLPETTAK